MADSPHDRAALLEEQIRTVARKRDLLNLQIAGFGSLNVPAHLVIEREDAERELAALGAELKRLRDAAIDAPYRGLLSFREQDAALFFGRESQVAELLAQVADASFLAVLGASGSGKSSLVHAGLLHALKSGAAGAPPGSPAWRYLALTPGPRPLDRLASALAGAPAADTPVPPDPAGALAGQLALRRELARDEQALLAAADLLLRERPGARLVLVVDQAEELWTLAPADPEARTRWAAEQQRPFIARLLGAAAAAGRAVLIVLSLRADFLHRALEQPALAALVERHLALVSPMQTEQLRAVIERPAERAGGRFEPGLVDELIRQTAGREGALPLLQYTLTQLWAQRDADGTCTWAVFRRLGGVEGALAARADAILERGYTQEQRAAVRAALLRLVQPGEGAADTRRRVALEDLAPDGDVAAVQALLQPLADERLLTTGRDPSSGAETVELSHEALIRAWPTLSGWIAEARDDLRQQFQLGEAAREWHVGGRAEDLLWAGLRLANAEAWLARAQPRLPARDAAFLDASRAAEQARRAAAAQARREREALLEARAAAERRSVVRLRWFLGIGGVLLALALVASALAVRGQQLAQQREREARRQALIAASQAASIRGEPDQALALALAAIDKDPDNPPDEVTTLVYQAADSAARRVFRGHSDVVYGVAFSPDGTTALSASKDGTLRLWDVATGQTIRTFAGHRASVHDLAFSPDGRTALSGSKDGVLRLWDVATGQPIRTFAGHRDEVNRVAFSPDGSTALSASDDQTLRLWDVASGHPIHTFAGHTGAVYGVAFSPDGKTALSAGQDGTLRLWDLASGQSIRTFTGHTGAVSAVAFSPDGKTAISASADTTLRLWDLATGETIRTFSGHTDEISAVTFSSDGKTVLSASDDMTLRLWDVTSGRTIRTFSGHTGAVLAVTFSPDGKTALSAGDDATLRLWDLASGLAIRSFAGHTDAVLGVGFSPDGKTALSASADGTLRLWDLASGQTIRIMVGHARAINDVAFSPDGSVALSASDDGTLRLWRVGTLLDQAAFVRANRYVPALSCEQRARYAVDPPCPAGAPTPAPATPLP